MKQRSNTKLYILLILILGFLCASFAVAAEAADNPWTNVMSGGFGQPSQELTIPNVVFQSSVDSVPYLYAGTNYTGSTPGAEIWRSSNGTSWSQVAAGGIDNVNNQALWPGPLRSTGTGFQGCLVATNQNWVTVTTGVVYRSCNGTTWSKATVTDFGNPNTYTQSGAVEVFQNKIYVMMDNSTTVSIYRSSDGINWDKATQDGFGVSTLRGQGRMASFDNQLYVTVNNPGAGFQIWRSSNGSNFNLATKDGFGDPFNQTWDPTMIVYKDCLYVSTMNVVNGTDVWRTCDGNTWQQLISNGFGNGAQDFRSGGWGVFNGYLYVGVHNGVKGASVWRTDGTTWQKVSTDGFGNTDNKQFWVQTVFNNKLYAGVYNEASGGQIWTLSAGATIPGSNVYQNLGSNVAVIFGTVSSTGDTTFSSTTTPPAPDKSGFSFLNTYYDVTTTSSYSGNITVCLPYSQSEITGSENALKIFHLESGVWVDRTLSVDTVNNIICASVSSLSYLGMGIPSGSLPSTGTNHYLIVLLGGLLIGLGTMQLKKQSRS